MAPSSKPVSNLIQGVSQQSPQQRRDSQCEAQFDCINSPKDGVVARHGGDLVKLYEGIRLAGACPYELVRGRDEHYLFLVRSPQEGGLLVLNLEDGAVGTLTAVSTSYLDTGGEPEVDSFAFQTVDDYTFVANKTVRPTMGPERSSSRPREALVFFKAGAYTSTYAISILWDGITYRWLYSTPDNSTSTNAAYIATNFLSAIFYRAMTGVVPSGNVDGRVGAVYGGDPGPGLGAQDTSVGSGGPTVTSLGFSMAINGNLLRIWRNDGRNFTIDTTDGAGDTYLVSFKDTVRSFGDLPRNGFEGFLLKVKAKPSQSDSAADYHVEYVNGSAGSGFWQERSAPSVPTLLDPQTMPHAIVNTARNAFEFGPVDWSSRIAGDGVDTAKDPGFVGKRIEDLFYHKQRLAILTESTVDFSKARNPFTHFPDTVQTLLSDAPIGITLSASDTVALLRRVAKVDEGLFLWAQGAQFRIQSGQDPFRQDTVEANDSTAYEFAERCNFARVGSTLYFATEPGTYATLRNLTFNQGRAVGDTDVTAHVSEYVPAGVRRLSASDTGQMLFVRSDGEPSALYLYNYLVQDRTVVQSAWNTWRLPVESVVWASVYRQDLLVLVQLAVGAALLRFPLRTNSEDHPGAGYLTRLDLRVREDTCLSIYDEATDTTTVRAPYPVPVAEGDRYRIVSRLSGAWVRGREALVLGRSDGGGLRVAGNWSGQPFYFGRVIVSSRQESTFYLRSEEGVVPADSINLREYNLRYASTGYSRIEVNIGAGREPRRHETLHVPIGSGVGLDQPPIIKSGRLPSVIDAPHEEATITLINDTWLPSRWQTADWRYEAVVRARLGTAGSSR